ncbi:MAG: NAD(P)/FAD-dependent oxidoreductase [Leuconostoc gelidum]|jgi:glutathione reductase (NADPH)|uniref:dihydrolipoyl dehydrogenase family protein n=1 Tax=Leuconostoc gelidum TaxID=1244 RepID=UPI0002193C7A|nr:NAD(P)/FAD-dependent oxidoreductase [Leuconostoc gelidum]AFS41191.1 glutathione reductase [Leuconostoc gelidum JB7]MBZ5978740.1 NAD(P)/FAD-dependent oxidoreductase [Leuconostoc gelidum subsp. gelidum]MBZ5992644.1 NAD(P)/FAD-dependent oxidoreductase [Leuconostoc gelidum subsp. gelidum]MBZ6001750.1 NAD(P)/FAD-dependent oxidoreductase [Leuconostoc gelidum subsp. gelidum]QDJ29210.1 glutathione reductase [Leuconostoc gelidum subsp. gelidum]
MTNQYDYDVLYLGSGHGTFDGAIPLAQSGVKVGVIEADMIGGTCPNYGCNAKITLDAPVVLTRAAERLSGIVQGNLNIDWAQNEAHKETVINGLPDMIGGLLTDSGIDVIHGRGVFEDNHTIVVAGKSVTADKIVISTGLRPHRLDISGSELAHDSREFMSLKTLPQKIAIIGSGYISMEFATIANAAGADITVFMHGDRALRQFHAPYVDKVVTDLKQRGVTFISNADVTAFEQNGDQIQVIYSDNQSLSVDWVLDASGRVPNVDNIGLETLGLIYNKSGIPVNDYLQTNIDNIYASGDVIDKTQPKLTPTAIFESTYLFKQFSGQTKASIHYPVVPSVVFTSPRIAQAGMLVQDAEKGDYVVQQTDLTKDWYRQVDNETLADNTLIFDQQHNLVGVTEVSEQAENVINTLLPAIEFKFGPDEIGRLIHLFPSIGMATWGQL